MKWWVGLKSSCFVKLLLLLSLLSVCLMVQSYCLEDSSGQDSSGQDTSGQLLPEGFEHFISLVIHKLEKMVPPGDSKVPSSYQGPTSNKDTC